MKKIIYTSDFSKNSIAALKYANFLGELFDVEVIALHVAKKEELKATKEENKKQARLAVKKQLDDFCSKNLGRDLNEVNLTTAVVSANSVTNGILDFIRNMEVQMLIMGACGSGTFKDFFLGSSTKDMLELSPFPLLAVPPNYKDPKLEKVIYTSDLEEEDLKNIAELVKILHPVKVKIVVLHVSDKAEQQVNELLTWFKDLLAEKLKYPHLEYKMVFSDEIFKTLKNNIEVQNPDMVVMLERQPRKDKTSILHRDMVKRFQSCTRVPLLSFRKIL